MLKTRLHPNCNRTIGVVADTGELLIKPLSDLGVRWPFTTISQLIFRSPSFRLLIQQQPVKLMVQIGELYRRKLAVLSYLVLWYSTRHACTIDRGEGDWQRKYLEIPSVFRPGFNRGLFPTWKLKIHDIILLPVKKSTSSSAAKHQLHQIFEAIWDTAHYLVKQP